MTDENWRLSYFAILNVSKEIKCDDSKNFSDEDTGDFGGVGGC